MQAKEKEKQLAIKLRKEGKTYSEILKQVPVAKSTLSIWLREVGLAKAQKQRITRKRIEAQRKGALRKREIRIEKTKKIYSEAVKEVGKLSKRELWLIGTALHWAEGAKEKKTSRGVGIDFANSDPRMIKLYVKWLTDVVGIAKEDITMGIYIHENHKDRIATVKRYWSHQTKFPVSTFEYVYFKKHNPRTKRKNVGENYHGLIRLRVKSSTDKNRKIAGWVQGILKYSGVV